MITSAKQSNQSTLDRAEVAAWLKREAERYEENRNFSQARAILFVAELVENVDPKNDNMMPNLIETAQRNDDTLWLIWEGFGGEVGY